jgi:hypothetical protein
MSEGMKPPVALARILDNSMLPDTDITQKRAKISSSAEGGGSTKIEPASVSQQNITQSVQSFMDGKWIILIASIILIIIILIAWLFYNKGDKKKANESNKPKKKDETQPTAEGQGEKKIRTHKEILDNTSKGELQKLKEMLNKKDEDVNERKDNPSEKKQKVPPTNEAKCMSVDDVREVQKKLLLESYPSDEDESSDCDDGGIEPDTELDVDDRENEESDGEDEKLSETKQTKTTKKICGKICKNNKPCQIMVIGGGTCKRHGGK